MLDPSLERVQCKPSYGIIPRADRKQVAFDVSGPAPPAQCATPGNKNSRANSCVQRRLSFRSSTSCRPSGRADNQSFVISNGVQCRHQRIGKAVSEDQLAAV
jgi:hypothetical protein